VFANLFNFSTPEPVALAMKFSGAAAAPLTLLALGVILSFHSIIPTKSVSFVVIIKLLLLPFVVWAILKIGDRPEIWNNLTILNSAGPSGAMAFALAMLHKVNTDKIAPGYSLDFNAFINFTCIFSLKIIYLIMIFLAKACI
jgi:predicted permease